MNIKALLVGNKAFALGSGELTQACISYLSGCSFSLSHTLDLEGQGLTFEAGLSRRGQLTLRSGLGILSSSISEGNRKHNNNSNNKQQQQSQ